MQAFAYTLTRKRSKKAGVFETPEETELLLSRYRRLKAAVEVGCGEYLTNTVLRLYTQSTAEAFHECLGRIDRTFA